MEGGPDPRLMVFGRVSVFEAAVADTPGVHASMLIVAVFTLVTFALVWHADVTFGLTFEFFSIGT